MICSLSEHIGSQRKICVLQGLLQTMQSCYRNLLHVKTSFSEWKLSANWTTFDWVSKFRSEV